MKNIIQIIILLGVSLSGFGQSLDRTVIGSAGTHNETAEGISLDFTVGEIAVALLGNGPFVAEGFHRSALSIVVSTEAPSSNWTVRIFPNPVTNWLQIELPETGAFNAQLNATNGQLLWQASLRAHSHQINLQTLPAGTYWLSIHNEKGEQQSFQIVKVDL